MRKLTTWAAILLTFPGPAVSVAGRWMLFQNPTPRHMPLPGLLMLMLGVAFWIGGMVWWPLSRKVFNVRKVEQGAVWLEWADEAFLASLPRE